jgi:type II secretory pathway pseudopilin PulG
MNEFWSALQGTGQAAREARAAQVNAEVAQQAAQGAREAAQAARQAADPAAQSAALADQIADAVRAAEDAANAGVGAVSVQGGPDGVRKVITLPNGQKIIINGKDVHFDGGNAGTEMDFRNAVPTGAVDIVQSLGATLAVCVVGFPLARAFGRWLDRRGSAPRIPAEVMTRLSSIENAVETVAVEVERISEGQRFTAKLLNERASRDLQAPVGAGDRAGR